MCQLRGCFEGVSGAHINNNVKNNERQHCLLLHADDTGAAFVDVCDSPARPRSGVALHEVTENIPHKIQNNNANIGNDQAKSVEDVQLVAEPRLVASTDNVLVPMVSKRTGTRSMEVRTAFSTRKV